MRCARWLGASVLWMGSFGWLLACGAADPVSPAGGADASAGNAGAGTGGGAGASAGGSAGASSGGSAGTSSGGSAGASSGGSAGAGASGGGAGVSGNGGAGGSAGGGSHTVGGVVSGLVGSGLVLRNNNADDLTIAMNGAFTFATPIASGQPYAVSVYVQPSTPEQTCSVQNGIGSIGSANVIDVGVHCELKDSDGDGAPDLADPFPNDSAKPKLAQPKTVYPHTSSKLFAMNVDNYAITEVGNFNGSGYSGSMTDLAVDQYGVVYGVTFDALYTCDANSATCYPLATLPQSFNGLTMVPPGVLHPFLDTLIAIANSGAWYQITLSGSGTATLTQLGSYGGGYTSSGDAFSIEGVGTFASVDKPGSSYDVIVAVDPKTGAVQNEVGPVNGYTTLYGLAGWQGVVFGFDSNGAVLKVDIQTGNTTLITQTSNIWWGAGVATRLAQ